MQPFHLAEQVRNAYHRYIRTSFPIRDTALEQEFERLVRESRLLWREPFISLSHPFRPGGTLEDLIHESVLSDRILRAHWGLGSLFTHQADAARRLSTLAPNQPRNTIVATGTGSGKTESFFIPIVDHCLRSLDSSSPGVQAIILYPMNALINDQLERLRVLLRGTGVRFGRYTGDTPLSPQDAQTRGLLPPDDKPEEEIYYRDEYANRLPHILLTNYTMLELLLLRKRDQAIFRGGALRYLVLDEVHTFTGILGSEVACLIRRLKQHAGVRPGELICVGTSATAKAQGASAEEELARFARQLFAEPFAADSVIGEAHESVRWPTERRIDPPPHLVEAEVENVIPDDAEAIRRLAERTFSVTLTSRGEAVYEELYNLCESRWLFAALEEALRAPRSLSTVVELLAVQPERVGLPEAELRAEATALLILGSVAHRNTGRADPEPRFRPKVHLQVRSLTPLNRCLVRECGRLLTDNRAECHHPECHTDAASALPLGICRSCGADYFVGQFVPPEPTARRRGQGVGRPRSELRVDELGQLELLAFERPDTTRLATLYLYPGSLEELVLEEDGELAIRVQAYHVCPFCRTAIPANEAHAPVFCNNTDCVNHQRDPLPSFVAFLGASKCPVCQAQGRGRRPEIITPLRSGAATSVAVLAQTLLPRLGQPDHPKPDPAKRLLIFADSRQDTAHQAGYLRDRHQVFTQRQIVYQMLHQREGLIPLTHLAEEVFIATRNAEDEVEAMNLLTPIVYKSPEEAGFIEPGTPISANQTRTAIARLRWDLSLEFTDRANSRYSLEREGLTAILYARLDDVAREAFPQFVHAGFADADAFENLLRALLDYLRLRRAVSYEPFRHYLSEKSDPVVRNIARPTRHTRTPVAIDRIKGKRASAYEVLAWYHSEPGRYQTGVYNIFARLMPHLSPPQLVSLIDAAVTLLESKGYLKRVTIGQLWQARGTLTTTGLQANEEYVEVTTAGERYRCPTCGATRSYLLRAADTGRPVCATYRCKGTPEPYVPDPAANFYVEFYTTGQPERLYSVEHSGQLRAEERVPIENKFKSGLINTLVCTPTLELGVNIGDLASLIMRNIPPTPSNYAQRAGRAGRKQRIALILSHSGQGPHDSYFFDHPEEMITGAIRPPVFLLDNRVVIDRHLNSLTLEKLDASVPTRWEEIRTEEGELRLEVLRPFEEELAGRGGEIQAAVEAAFVHERSEGGLSWLTPSHVRARMDAFVPGLRAGLEHWCRRYREIYAELKRSRAKTRPSDADRAREGKLVEALTRLETDLQYNPLSYLATVGFLPRYGFPGDLVSVTDARQRQITQAAAVGITEYAPGNIVYVGGRKLEVDRILFRGGSKDDPRQNAETYHYCPNCNFVALKSPGDDPLLVVECDYCHGPLTSARYVDYEAAHGRDRESITQEDEYRDRQDYQLATYLLPRQGNPDPRDKTVPISRWSFAYSRLRSVEIFNRGLIDRQHGGITPTVVCLECGKWREPSGGEEAQPRADGRATGHEYWCTVPTWNPKMDDRLVASLHLRAHLQGDVVEVPLSPVVAQNVHWIETFAQALKLGMQLEFFVGAGEVNSSVRHWEENGETRASLVFYDTMPGGTGYLQRLVDELPHIAARALRHLEDCDCERACYRCLMEFWNQRQHALFDKRLVLSTLQTLASSAPEMIPTPPDAEARFDSFLESRFYALLAENGLPLPKTQQVIRSQSGRHIARADFRYEDRRLIIFTDGRQFHANSAETIRRDHDQRNRLMREGWRLLEFTYHDVIERPEHVLHLLRVALDLKPLTLTVSVAPSTTPLPAEVQALAEQLSADPTQRNCRVELSNGFSAHAIVCDPGQRRATIWVDTRRWLGDESAWVSDVEAGNCLRLLGWRAERVATGE